jgi:hypothetical protein
MRDSFSDDYEAWLNSSMPEMVFARHSGTLKDIGKVAVWVDIERPEKVAEYGLAEEAILKEVEQQLIENGLGVVSAGSLIEGLEDNRVLFPFCLYINVNVQIFEEFEISPISTTLRFLQCANLLHMQNTVCLATTWEKSAIQMGLKTALSGVTDTVKRLVACFVDDYLQANREGPAKPNEQST